MVNQIAALIESIRPTHWIKNLVLFAALVFSGNLFQKDLLQITVFAFIVFCLAASCVYLFNDVVDRQQDLLHPVKKYRPIAKGIISVQTALFMAAVFGAAAVFAASFLSFFFMVTVIIYIFLQAVYALWLKSIPVADILTIAAGFILRVWAGAFAINIHLSVWFLLCVISTSLFLAAGKRRTELTILAQYGKLRKSAYEEPRVLDSYLIMFGTAAWMSWALFTFFEPSPRVGLLPFSGDLPLTLAGIGKWLMLTIPVVIFGVMRYLNITYTTTAAETPEKTLMQDKALLVSFLLWGGLMILILYGL